MADDWESLPVVKPVDKKDDWESLPVVKPSAPAEEPSFLNNVSDFVTGKPHRGHIKDVGLVANPTPEQAAAAPANTKQAIAGTDAFVRQNATGQQLAALSYPSVGLIPPLYGAVHAIPRALAQHTVGGRPKGLSDLVDAYRHERDTAKEAMTSATDQHPYAAMLGGAVGPEGLEGMMAQGAMSGLGNSSGDFTKNPVHAAFAGVRDAGLGAGGGALAHLGGALVGKGAGWLAGKLGGGLRKGAEHEALEAISNAGISDPLAKRGYGTEAERDAFGGKLLDNNLIKPFDKAANIQGRATAMKEAAGPQIGDILERADNTMMPPPPPGQRVVGVPSSPQRFKFDQQAAAQHAMDTALPPEASLNREAVSQKANDYIQRIANEQPGLVASNRLKSDAYKSAAFSNDPSLAEEVYRDVARGHKESIERGVEQALGPKEAAALRNANQTYGLGSDIETIAGNAASRQAQKKHSLLMDLRNAAVAAGMAGGPAATMHHGLGIGLGGLSGALTLGGSLMRNRGASTAAVGLNAASKLAKGSAPVLEQGGELGGRSVAPRIADALQALGKKLDSAGADAADKRLEKSQEQDALDRFSNEPFNDALRRGILRHLNERGQK